MPCCEFHRMIRYNRSSACVGELIARDIPCRASTTRAGRVGHTNPTPWSMPGAGEPRVDRTCVRCEWECDLACAISNLQSPGMRIMSSWQQCRNHAITHAASVMRIHTHAHNTHHAWAPATRGPLRLRPSSRLRGGSRASTTRQWLAARACAGSTR